MAARLAESDDPQTNSLYSSDLQAVCSIAAMCIFVVVGLGLGSSTVFRCIFRNGGLLVACECFCISKQEVSLCLDEEEEEEEGTRRRIEGVGENFVANLIGIYDAFGDGVILYVQSAENGLHPPLNGTF